MSRSHKRRNGGGQSEELKEVLLTKVIPTLVVHSAPESEWRHHILGIFAGNCLQQSLAYPAIPKPVLQVQHR